MSLDASTLWFLKGRLMKKARYYVGGKKALYTKKEWKILQNSLTILKGIDGPMFCCGEVPKTKLSPFWIEVRNLKDQNRDVFMFVMEAVTYYFLGILTQKMGRVFEFNCNALVRDPDTYYL